MKKVLITIISILSFTLVLNAKGNIVNISSIDEVNDSINSFGLSLDDKSIYFYNTNKFNCVNYKCSESNFNLLGIISTSEYFLIGGSNSYLVNKSDYFSLDNNSIRTISIDKVIDGNESYLRASNYVKKGVRVTGSGKKSDPWIFVYPNYLITINIEGGNINGISKYIERLNDYNKEYIASKDADYYYIKDINEDIVCDGDVNYSFVDNKLILNDISSNVTCSIKYTPSKYLVTLELTNATSKENNYRVTANNSKSVKIVPTSSSYAFESAVCTNNQVFDYSEYNFTIKNITSDTTCKLIYKKVDDVIPTKDGEYVVPYDGYYLLESKGAQGSGNGGKGGEVNSKVYLYKGQVLKYYYGTTSNGANSVGEGSYAGGGSSRYSLNNELIAVAAGGGGGSSGTAGGNGDSLGGTNSNDSSKNGIDGVNGSGGSSALDSTVCTEFVTQGGGCKERETTPYSCCTNWVTDRICATGETECGDTFCDGYTQGSTASSECYKKCGETLTGTTCKETTTCASYGTCYDYGACTEYYPTKEVCNKTDTIYGTSGNGGKNIYKLVVNNKETKIEFKIGSNSGNGYLKISYIGETI